MPSFTPQTYKDSAHVSRADVAAALATVAPPNLAEDYDNVGLLVGEGHAVVDGLLLTLDVTEEVVAEAVARGCNTIVAHHPIIFRGLKQLTGKTYVDRTVMAALRAGIGIIACHTNLDKVNGGVSTALAQLLGLNEVSILAPEVGRLGHFITFVPQEFAAQAREALAQAGAGNIGEYEACSFTTTGDGRFRPSAHANPKVGEREKLATVAEERIEVLYPLGQEQKLLRALRAIGYYEEVAYFASLVQNSWQEAGLGAVGHLQEPQSPDQFLHHVKQTLGLRALRYCTGKTGKAIHKVAVCGGTGSFLTKAAIACGADAYITADMKYHEWFDATGQVMLLDVGHYESEKHVPQLLGTLFQVLLPNIALQFSTVGTNPVIYH